MHDLPARLPHPMMDTSRQAIAKKPGHGSNENYPECTKHRPQHVELSLFFQCRRTHKKSHVRVSRDITWVLLNHQGQTRPCQTKSERGKKFELLRKKKSYVKIQGGWGISLEKPIRAAQRPSKQNKLEPETNGICKREICFRGRHAVRRPKKA